MDDRTATSESIGASRNILGYKLKERIGSGGFGEVWSAEAPGGLMKAVKIVYGYHDEKRAQAELKSLDRVKDLRHPFLLSLERIEIFEGQLIVVSELADKSMADLFEEYAAKGEPGIPRELLVKYLRDTADALDYLSREHSLQHLDVKPENLLMVGSHVKVADFGLVKDLHKQSMSLMSGMTPAYAAPELFDGQPGPLSDQYSLAIVYQEMLTSVRPFPGSTPAQLAAQHMHGKPNVQPLPKDDRAIIAKALSKDPNVRYASCVQMAEELLNRQRTNRKSVRRIELQSRNTDETATRRQGDRSLDFTAVVDTGGLPFLASEIQTLEPPKFDATEAAVRPMLIVGVGATGNRVVHQIKQRLESLHGSVDALPSIQLVAIDNDATDLGKITGFDDPNALSTREAIHVPLGRPEQYRRQASSSLSWLSRRWIYNIPRSLRTEGLRPLGRLLFASHFETLFDRLKGAIEDIIKPENLATTAETLEMNPGTVQPRVFLVSSIGGGIGSGMTLDLAYTIKLLMAECGLADGSVTGMMLHSTNRRGRDPGLAAANAFAFLTELRHFVEAGYPGDRTLGIPEFEGEMPFDQTYYRHLGDDLSQSQLDTQISSIAEYIYLSGLTNCSTFLDSCRDMESEREHFALRTCGLSVSGPGSLESDKDAANRLSMALIRQWTFGDPADEPDVAPFVAATFEQQRLTETLCLEDITERVDGLLAGEFDEICLAAAGDVMSSDEQTWLELSSHMDGRFGIPTDRQDTEYRDPEICLQMMQQIDNRAMIVGDEICTAVMALLEQPQFNLGYACAAKAAFDQEFETLVTRVDSKLDERTEAANSLLRVLRTLESNGGIQQKHRDKVHEVATQYGELRLQAFGLQFARRYYRSCQRALAYAEEHLQQYRSQLETISNQFVTDELPLTEDAEHRFSMDQLLVDSIKHDLNKHIGQTEVQVYESLIREQGGYLAAMATENCWQRRLPIAIRTAAKSVLADAYRKLSLDQVIASQGIGLEQLVKWLNDKFNEARPVVNDCGGASRVMIGLPELSTDGTTLPEMIHRQFSVTASAVNGTRGNVVICFESEDVALASVAYRLLETRPDALELVPRIHTRTDIEWKSLSDLL